MLIISTSVADTSIHDTSPLFGAGAATATGAVAAAAVAVAVVAAGAGAGVCASEGSAMATPQSSASAARILFISDLPFVLERVRAGLAGADPHDLQQVEYEDLAVADLAGVGSLLDRFD